MSTPFSSARGITLIGLLIAVTIVGIIAAISFPMYRDYVTSARRSVMNDSMQQIRLFQEDRRQAKGEYIQGIWNPSTAVYTLRDRLGWEPRDDKGTMIFTVTCSALRSGTNPNQECTRTATFTIQATHIEGGECGQLVSSGAVTEC